MSMMLTTTKTPLKDLLHLLMDEGKSVHTHVPEAADTLAKISALCTQIINPETSVIYTENVSPARTDSLLKACRIPWTIREPGILKDGRIEYKISEAQKEIRGDESAVKEVLIRYLDECYPSGTMIEIDAECRRFTQCLSDIYDAIYGPFYDDIFAPYSVDDLNVLLMHRRIPYRLRKQKIISERYIGYPMDGFTISKCNW